MFGRGSSGGRSVAAPRRRAAALKERWTGCVPGRPVPPVGGVISVVVADHPEERLQICSGGGAGGILRVDAGAFPWILQRLRLAIINKFSAGTPIAERDPHAPSRYGIALATLDDDPGLRPAAHTFVAYKAPWFEITDDLPQYPESRQSRKASPVSDGLLA